MFAYWQMCNVLSLSLGIALDRFSQCGLSADIPTFTMK
ncbi:hypothetical protein RINTHH_17410 [Richelia intracellularis HH01]|uniref:Uncharacterized protein n=1 Tax=Richelia intracellularis HH01 TaxID=1165094 RepID=M1X658_9NOST|nr:hypothetical protein RINTHH_17410 [Richelia intracellularis HH01]